MKPKVVTFDCANTLVRVKWTPGGFALDCAREIGLVVGDEDRAVYERSLRARWAEYQEINRSRDASQCDAFWLRLTEDWLAAIGKPAGLSKQMNEAAPRLLYGEASSMFELFEDVLPTIAELDARGIRVGIISNWDYTLHRVLDALEVRQRFEYVVASLEEGVEKPEARLFHLTLEKFGVAASEAVHVGDDPIDDFQGAQDVGMRAYLIDRRRPESRGAVLAQLTDLIEAIERD
ncbi:MAG: HAD-IA family hydrolase [Fimbriimonadales bacterium]